MERVASTFGVGMEQVRRDHLISHVLAAIATDISTDNLVFFGGHCVVADPSGRCAPE